jgi:hypothetical protein
MEPDGARVRSVTVVAVQELTVRDVDGFNFSKSVLRLNGGRRLVPSRAGRLGVTGTGGVAADLNVGRQFGKIAG